MRQHGHSILAPFNAVSKGQKSDLFWTPDKNFAQKRFSLILFYLILFEMLKDRHQKRVKLVFVSVLVALLIGIAGLILGPKIIDESNFISKVIILTVSVTLAQGYWHKISLIIKSGKTGAVNIRMNQFILAMDFSTLFLAYTMGFSDSWPMVVLATVSGVTKLMIMYLFRWVRLSPIAASRRTLK